MTTWVWWRAVAAPVLETLPTSYGSVINLVTSVSAVQSVDTVDAMSSRWVGDVCTRL